MAFYVSTIQLAKSPCTSELETFGKQLMELMASADVIPHYRYLRESGDDYVSSTLLLPKMVLTNIVISKKRTGFLSYSVHVGDIAKIVSFDVVYGISGGHIRREAKNWRGHALLKCNVRKAMRKEDAKIGRLVNMSQYCLNTKPCETSPCAHAHRSSQPYRRAAGGRGAASTPFVCCSRRASARLRVVSLRK